jgi:hypothetical protein
MKAVQRTIDSGSRFRMRQRKRNLNSRWRSTISRVHIEIKSPYDRNCHFMPLRSDQSIVLQPGESTGNYISYRTYANSNLMVGQREVKFAK